MSHQSLVQFVIEVSRALHPALQHLPEQHDRSELQLAFYEIAAAVSRVEREASWIR
jgi:hypothetical protein